MEVISKPGAEGGKQGTMVFMHGAWHGAWCWDLFTDYLASQGWNCHALDLPGHGRRRGEDVSGQGIMDYVASLKEVVDQYRSENPVVVGHSMGGLIVQKFLETEIARAAILVAPCPAMGASLGTLGKFTVQYPIDGLKVLFGSKLPIKNEAMYRHLFFREQSPENLTEYARQAVAESCRAIRQMVIPGLKLTARKAKAPTPVLVVGAGTDYFFPIPVLKAWAASFGYDFLAFEKHCHNMMCEAGYQDIGDRFLSWIASKA